MLMIKVALFMLISAILGQLVVESRNIGKKKLRDADYEASGDYFENAHEESTTKKDLNSFEDENSDDGVTCSETNVTQILQSYELENLVLVFFKVNFTENEKELIYFLKLAKRFSQAPSIFSDHRFIVLTMDQSSELVNEIIDKGDFPSDLIAIDEREFPDLGFVIDFDELHVYIVDQCGKLAYIIVPPYSSAEQPYVKAGILSTLVDLPCGCPASEFYTNRLDEIIAAMSFQLGTTGNENNSDEIESTTSWTSTTEAIEMLEATSTKLLLNDDEDIENINDLIDNANNLSPLSLNATDNTTLPLRIIIPSDHVHFDEKSQNYYKYEHIILRSDDNNYHGHFNDVETLLDIDNERIKNFTGKIFVGNNSISDIKTLSRDKILVNRLGFFYQLSNERGEKTFDIKPLEFDVIKVSPYTQIYGVKQHYQKLNKWLNYAV